MTPDRKPLYAKIAIARKQLPHMDEEAYRGLLESEFNTRSAKALRHGQLCRLVDILGRMGASFAAGNNPRHKPHVRSDFYEIADDEFGKTKRYIAAVWRNDLGYDMTGLDTTVERMFGVASFAWLRDWDKLKRLACHVEARARAKADDAAAGDGQGAPRGATRPQGAGETALSPSSADAGANIRQEARGSVI